MCKMVRIIAHWYFPVGGKKQQKSDNVSSRVKVPSRLACTPHASRNQAGSWILPRYGPCWRPSRQSRSPRTEDLGDFRGSIEPCPVRLRAVPDKAGTTIDGSRQDDAALDRRMSPVVLHQVTPAPSPAGRRLEAATP